MMTILTPYDLPAVKIDGYDVVVNKPKVAAYRAPGAPMAAFGAESVMDEVAEKLGMDPVDFRLKNAAKEGVTAPYGPKFGAIGLVDTLEEAKSHPHYKAPLGPNQGRGVATGFWFNAGMQSSANVSLNEDGTAVVVSGNPDIGGSRASLSMMAAEELGIPVERVPSGRGRHRDGSVQRPDRREPSDLCHRHGCGGGSPRCHHPAASARGCDLGTSTWIR